MERLRQALGDRYLFDSGEAGGFLYLSPDAENEYFSDGMTEELSSTLHHEQ